VSGRQTVRKYFIGRYVIKAPETASLNELQSIEQLYKIDSVIEGRLLHQLLG
jgi:hypothetical protein